MPTVKETRLAAEFLNFSRSQRSAGKDDSEIAAAMGLDEGDYIRIRTHAEQAILDADPDTLEAAHATPSD